MKDDGVYKIQATRGRWHKSSWGLTCSVMDCLHSKANSVSCRGIWYCWNWVQKA